MLNCELLGPNFITNYQTCKCECNPDFVKKCDYYEMFLDPKTCECNCEKAAVEECKARGKNFVFNFEDCSCDCPKYIEESCKAQGLSFIPDKCACDGCPPVECLKYFIQDPLTCDCKCGLDGPPPPALGCGRASQFSYQTCKCELACDWIEECPTGERWDLFSPCQCVSCSIPEACRFGMYYDVNQCKCV
jgi:hypothetical protein